MELKEWGYCLRGTRCAKKDKYIQDGYTQGDKTVSKIVDVIIRKSAEKTVLNAEGNLSVSISAPSVIQIHASPTEVVRYERVGNDLLIYMQDGSVIRCNGYFIGDPESEDRQSVLVFADDLGLTHISFADIGQGQGLTPFTLTPQATAIDSIEPFLESSLFEGDTPWGWIAGAALGGGAIGALLAHDSDGDDHTRTEVIDNTKEVESITPTFTVSDKQGDRQGLLAAKAITDDATPTFSGTGQPGATIQIKDASGSTIASAMVGKDGTWSVLLPTQSDGTHTWSVVQIDGNDSTKAGDITLTVSTKEAAITLNATATDNVVNGAEQAAGFTLSGSSSQFASGSVLTVTLNGKSYSATVGDNGAWNVKVPAADAQALGDGNWTVSVTGKDITGNTISGSQALSVDTRAPTLTLDPVTADSVINAQEKGESLILTGRSDAEPGQTVTVGLNGKSWSATVGSDGRWSVTLDAGSVATLAEGKHNISASVSDKAGNQTNTQGSFTVDTSTPVVTLDAIGGDNVLNGSELSTTQMISGRVTGASAGDTVVVKLGEHSLNTIVQADGSWSVAVPPSLLNDFTRLHQMPVSVSVTNAAGNSGSASSTVTLSSDGPTFTVDPISQDSVLNAQEAQQPLSLSGASNLADGSTVTVTLNNQSYQTTVNGGQWQLQVPVEDVLKLANTLYTVTVSGADEAGNPGSASASVLVDTVLPTVIINTFAGDNQLNASELAQVQTLSGRVTGAVAGDIVTIRIGNHSYEVKVEDNLTWSLDLPASALSSFGDGALTIEASVTNGHHNTGNGTLDISITAQLPGIRINTVSGDDVVNAIERQQDLTITGTSEHLAEGTTVTVIANGKSYITAVDASGNWRIGVSARELADWPAGDVVIRASAQDVASNPAGFEQTVTVDLNEVAITIDTVSLDDVINAAEKGAVLALSGMTQGVEPGQSVVVSFAGQRWSAKVQDDGSWHLEVPATAMDGLMDGRAEISVSVTNVNGNSAQAGHQVIIDSAAPTLTIDALAVDDVLNATEQGQPLTISGNSTAQAGQTVTVILNDKSYTATVNADGRWSLKIEATDLADLTDGNFTVNASVADKAGNPASASHELTVDTAIPTITINTVAGDDIINSTERGQNLIVSGSSSGLKAGASVTLVINDKSYSAIVMEDGNWQAGIPAVDVSQWPQGGLTVSASGTSSAGNPTSAQRPVTVEVAEVSIAINTLATDDVINAAEKGLDLTLSGTTGNVEVGQTITLTFGGRTYTTQVQEGGVWSLEVPAADLRTLADGDASVQASVSNKAGNAASDSHDYRVDTQAPGLTIDTLAGDNILNAAEKGLPLTVSGTSTAEAGQTVSVILNGKSYTAIVQADGKWSLEVPDTDLAALKDGNVTISATVSDKAGNESTTAGSMLVDATRPEIAINDFAIDNVINQNEQAQTQMVSGRVSGAAAGDKVTVTLGENSWTTVLDASGNWSLGLPASAIEALEDGSYTLSVSVTDAAGNTGTQDRGFTVNTQLPTIAIDTIAGDDVINALEKGGELAVTGTSNQPSGTTITLMLNGVSYTTTTGDNGVWSVTLPASALGALGEANYTLTASVTDVYGNSNSADRAVQVDSARPQVTIDAVTSDNIINAAELAAGQTLTGKVSGAASGDSVTVMMGGKSYEVKVQDDLSWKLELTTGMLTALGDGGLTISASVTNGHGNTGSAERDIAIDASIPGLRINTVSGDDIVNSIEHNQALVISGTSEGLSAGASVTLTINGKTYTATVRADGSWQTGVDAADVAQWPEGKLTIDASAQSSVGNPVAIGHQVTVDLDVVAITINSVTADDVLNAAERGETLTLSGSTSNVEAGRTVTITFGGKTYTAKVEDGGSWSLEVAAADLAKLPEGTASVQVSVTNNAGNGAQAGHEYRVDTQAPGITIDTLAGDNILNAAEQGQPLTVSGTTTAEAGQEVTVTLNGKPYTTTVNADGKWTLDIPAADLAALKDGNVTLSAAVTDKAGNPASAASELLVDGSVPTVTIHNITADNVVNQAEHGQALVITGSSSNAQAGDRITITLNGKTYITTLDADGNWSLGIPAADVGLLTGQDYTLTASLTDKAGNQGGGSHDFKVVLSAPSIAIDTIAGDDVINALEKGGELAVTGTSNQPSGTTITLVLNGVSYTTTTGDNGVWSVTLPASALGALGEANYTLTASVTDVYGNSNSADRAVQVDSARPQVTIDAVTSDNIINAAELAAGQTLTGKVSGAASGDSVTVMMGGKSYEVKVQDDLSWKLELSPEILNALGDGELTISASVTNGHGNTGSAERDIAIDAGQPGLRINTISGDDIVNSIEHNQALVISGSSEGLNSGATVTLTINGKTYTATVKADGSWQTGVDAADVAQWPEGKLVIDASAQSSAGNPVAIGHQVTVDLDVVAITINSVTADDVLNAAELGETLTLSGSTSNVEAGRTVTITFGGKTYTAKVEDGGGWSLEVAAADLAKLPEGTASVQVSVTNNAGNGAQAGHEYRVDTQAPGITIDTLAGDNILNAAEKGQPLTVSGTTTAEAGQEVTVTLNGKPYTTTVNADGKWTLDIPATDLANLDDGKVTVSASVSDKAGNPVQTQSELHVDATVPVITISSITADDVINQTEHAQALIISGDVKGAATGDVVTVTIGSNSWVTTVDAAGKWSVGIPDTAVSALEDNGYRVTVSVTDAAGNSSSESRDFTVDTAAPTLSIGTIAGDNILNEAEKGQPLTITGGSNGLAVNTTVTVTLNGKNYTGTTDSSGNWSVTVPAGDLTALGEAFYQVSVSATDSVGNTGNASHTLGVDSQLPGVVFDTVAGDDVINAAELAAGQTLTGRVSGAASGDTVTIMMGGKNYEVKVQDDLSWKLELTPEILTALGNGDLTISASVTNASNNTGSTSHEITIDASIPGLRINTVSGDDIVNSIEHNQALVISGTSEGLSADASVTLTINGKTYTATVNADGSWQTGVEAADVAQWPEGKLVIDASAQSSAGNPVAIDHQVTVDLSAVAIAINSITADDVLNAAERGEALTLSGTTSNVEAGRTVTITFGGKTYTAKVEDGGGWSLEIPAADLAKLPEGTASVQVSVTNNAGNSAQAGHEYRVDSQAPGITINALAGDDVLNAAEQGQPLTVSGTTTAEAGQTVTVSLNGETYSATVQADGIWSLEIPAADLANLNDGNITLNASVTDKAGNPSSADRAMTVDATIPVVTINTVAGDDVINQTEHGQAQIISGSVTGANTGDKVTVTLGDHSWTTVVDAAGNWSLGVPADVVSALQDGKVSIDVTVTDAAGNSGSASHNVTVDTGLPSLSFDTLAGDGILNATEKGQPLVLSGTSAHLAAGTVVTVMLNGKRYSATVDDSGNWRTEVPVADLAGLGEAGYTLTATATNGVGNSVNASGSLTVDTAQPGVTIDSVTADNIINAAELAAGQTLTGRVSGAASGDTVTIMMGGKNYEVKVQDDLSWKLELTTEMLTALGDGGLTITASVTNGHGNTGSAERDIAIDASIPGLRINTVSGDDIVNSIEHNQALVISGSSEGLSAGASVTLTINGKTYTATVNADGSWQTGVEAADVAQWPEGKLVIDASAQSSAGNPVAIDHQVTVDLSAVAIAINSITADDVLNAAERGEALTLSGTTSNVEAGRTVTITFGGKTYTAKVEDGGGWSLEIPAADLAKLPEGTASVQVSVTNNAGNSAQAGHEYRVDSQAPGITINALAGDDVLNAAEQGQPLTVSGTTTAEAGQTVTVSLNGETYSATVQADGSWSLEIPAADLANLNDGNITLNASVTDKAGNPSSADRAMTVDATIPVVTINTVAGDDVINQTEHGQAQIISGSVTGANTGDKVTVTLGDHSWTTVVDAAGNWSLGVPADVVSALQDGKVSIDVTVTDAAGNSGSASHNVTVDTGLPSLSFDTLAGDGILNATEKGQPLVLSGTSAHLAAGTVVTVMLNGKRYSATVDDSGNWRTEVPVADLAGLGEAGYTLTATATNGVGNSVNASGSLTVDTAQPGVTIDSVTADNIINAAELAAGQTLTGRVSGAASGDTVTIMMGGKNYEVKVQDDLSWKLELTTEMLTALGDGGLTITASVTNGHGNSGSAERDIAIDASIPGLRINTVSGDDIVNSIEHNQALVISGSSEGLSVGASVTLTINGKTYSATVNADGSWQTGVDAADVAQWPEGKLVIDASAQSSAGNPVAIDHQVTVDLSAVAIAINSITADDVLNAAERGEALTLSGTTSNVEAGRTVTITFGGKTYTAKVEDGGGWSLEIPAADLAKLPEGTASVQVSVTNNAGNSAQAGHEYRVDSQAPGLTIDTIAGDNLINASEAGAGVTVKGTSDAEAGQTVTLTLGGKQYQARVQADGSWSLELPGSDLTLLADASYPIQASVSDKAGNTTNASTQVILDTQAPTLTFNKVAGDDVINRVEHDQAQIISGSVTGANTGDKVTLTLGDHSWTTTVDAAGHWSVGVPAEVIAALEDGTLTLNATVVNSAGNSASQSHDLVVNTTEISLSVNTVAGDDVINATEAGGELTISGGSHGLKSGAAISVNLNGKDYSVTVGDSGAWSLTVPAEDVAALADGGSYSAIVSAQDTVGNSASASHAITVDTSAPAIALAAISTDNMLNALEQQQPLTLRGTSSAEPGQTVTVTLGEASYTTTVLIDGSWTLNVAVEDLASLAEGALNVTASVSDKAGNSTSQSATLTVDTLAPTLTFNAVASDNVINIAEQQAGQSISGTTTAEVGQVVTVSFNNRTYTATVGEGGIWSVTVPASDFNGMADGNHGFSATVTDKAGNSVTQSGSLSLDLTAPTITFNPVATDDVVNAAEQLTGQTVSGTTTAEAGQTITVTFNGNDYTATVGEGGSWSITLSAEDFNGLQDGRYTLSAKVTDKAGNGGSGSHEFALSGEVPSITIDTIAQDDIINAAEHGAALVISGTSGGAVGQTVTVTLNGKSYTATVKPDGSWSATVGSADVAALADGSAWVVYAEVDNLIGNTSHDDRSITVDLAAPSMTISIDALQSDSGLSATDFITRTTPVTVEGSLGAALGSGEKAQISLDGGTTWIDLTVTGTSWRYEDGRQLDDGTWNYQVRVVDNAGNVGATDSQDVVVDTVAPQAAAISVDSVSRDTGLASDDFITSDNSITLKGKLGAALSQGEHAQVSLDGGKTWTDVDVSGQDWTYVDGRELADGDYNYQLRVIDDAGNISATTSQVVTVDTRAPTTAVTIDSISDDTGLSASDFVTRDTTLTIHGSLAASLIEGEYVQISLDGGNSWLTVTTIGNSWYYNDTRVLEEGSHDYWVRVVDDAGNVGSTVRQTVTVDTTAPDAVITVNVDSISEDTGFSDSDFITSDKTLTLNGSLGAEPAQGDHVQISIDGGKTWVDVEVSGTSWRYTDTRELADDVYTYQMRVVDQAGNVSATTSQQVTVDTTPPDNLATIVEYSDDVGASRGRFGAGTTTDERTPVLHGTLGEALGYGEIVRIYTADGVLLGEAAVNGTEWSFALTEPASDGDTPAYQAVVVDAAGNEGTRSPEFSFTVDLPLIVNAQDTLDITPIVSGTIDFRMLDGEYMEVTVNNVTYSSRTGAVVIDPNNSTWYVQIPDSDALAIKSYEVQATLYAADGTKVTADDSTSELTVSPTPEITFTATAASSDDTGTALTIGEDGTWRILSNSTIFTQNGTSSSTLGSFSSVSVKGTDTQQQSSFIDFDRDGLMDLMGADTGYSNGQQSFKYNEDGTWTAFQVGANGATGQANDINGNTWVWYGGFMGIDIDGDGYVDLVYGDETPNDANGAGGYDSQIVMNTDGTITGFDKTGAYVETATSQDGVAATNTGNATPDREVSGVDLNNDGYVDIVYHGTVGTNRTSGGGSSASLNRLVVVSNGEDSNGNYTLTNTQIVTNVFWGDSGVDNYYTTMTWADLNGDGYMDLFLGGMTNQGGTYSPASTVLYNDGSGNLTAATNGVGTASNLQSLGDNVNSMTSLAVDWNGDGRMDLIEIAGAAGNTATNNAANVGLLWLNNGVNSVTGQVNWSSSTLITNANNGTRNFATGALALDLDYDGDRDLVMFRAAGGATEYVENTSVINDGTSIILRITDANGINSFYGNTVLLVDEATGKVVGSQVINPQGGVNMNDSSALVYFYGLDADKSYSAVLLANGNDYGGIASVTLDSSGVINDIENVNASWGGLKAVEKNHAYALTAEDGAAASDSAQAASDGTNSVGILGTGYNDTLYATAGTHVYNGGGGSKVVSDSNVWSADGGMDIVDYKLAGDSALTIDLSSDAQQDTGFGKATFVNIEGIAGGSGNDTFTGSSGDNYFEGRGGNDTFNIGNGGQDTLLYKLLNANDATGGNGSDVVNGFTVGTWEGTADTDRIDLRELLADSDYSGSGSATYVNGVATLDASAGNISDYIQVVQNGSNTEIRIDRDGTGSHFDPSAVITLNGVQTDLATLLANHQLQLV
jgi:hypothetical protein